MSNIKGCFDGYESATTVDGRRGTRCQLVTEMNIKAKIRPLLAICLLPGDYVNGHTGKVIIVPDAAEVGRFDQINVQATIYDLSLPAHKPRSYLLIM
uniref:Type II toxin-antitoxin system PemK/MazF family toxin n=1 Tax=Angiostrongylus cantonensis TaxID=6313 RepID=A0A0K0DGK8_ANGCA